MRSFFLIFAAITSLAAFGRPETNIIVDPNSVHIGSKTNSSFPELLRKPSAPRLDRSFESQANAEEWTLRLKQQHVMDDWGIELNGRALDRLNIGDSERVAHFAVPPRTLVDGTNTLAIFPQDKTNSIIVSQIEIIPQRMRDLLKLAHVVLNVTDLSGRFPIP